MNANMNEPSKAHQIIVSVLLSFQNCFNFFFVRKSSVIVVVHALGELAKLAEVDAREERNNEIVLRHIVEQTRLAVIRIINRLEQVRHMVGLSKVILDVIVLGWYAELDELVFESSRLLEEAMHFTVDFHFL